MTIIIASAASHSKSCPMPHYMVLLTTLFHDTSCNHSLVTSLDLCIVTPSGTSATDHSTPSSSVLCCCFWFPPAVLEARYSRFFFQLSPLSVLWLPPSSVAPWCPLNTCFANVVIASSHTAYKPLTLSSS